MADLEDAQAQKAQSRAIPRAEGCFVLCEIRKNDFLFSFCCRGPKSVHLPGARNQIESDRRQISRLNKKIDELGKASLEDKEENLRLRANIAELQDELKHKTNAIQQLNSRIQRTNSNPVRPIQTLQNSFNSTTLEGKRDLLSLLIAPFVWQST